MSTRSRSRAIAAVVLAVILAGCDSGGGPLHRPDLSPDRVVGAAVVALAAEGRFGSAGPVAVLDHLDPETVLADVPDSIRSQYAEWADAPTSDRLSDGLRKAIEASLPGQRVDFVPIEGAPLASNDAQCGTPEEAADLGTFLRFAMLPGMAAHGDVYLVVVEAHNGCGDRRWSAARMLWQPTGLIGGEWYASEVIDGLMNP